jgi:hypothetical protein
MKKYFFRWLAGTFFFAALLSFTAQSAVARGMGGHSMGFHSSGFHHDGFHRDGFHHFGFHHDGRFFHHHHFFHDRSFFAFGYPFYGYPYYDYPYYYPYDYEYDYGGPDYSYQYYSDLTAAVQTELKRSGYYRGPVDGIAGSDTIRAIQAYRKANGLPSTGQIDRRLLKSLDI